ncbi:MAG: S8 family serine peptidase [Phycisphaerae bacterium]|nr:S8 family serine peptidase [Phycisphaerae bacterium]
MIKSSYRIFFALCFLTVWSARSSLGQTEPGVLLQPAALDWTGTYSLRRTEPALTGKEVTIAAVCRSLTYLAGKPQDDYRLNIDHACFGSRDIHFADGLDASGGVSFHSTAIGGILVGSDAYGFHPYTGPFYYQGAAPGARVDVYEFWRFISLYVYGSKEFKADILTMSVGSVFEDWWTRGIERLADEHGVLIFAGIGNGTAVHDPVFYPGAGSNIIGVGVVDSLKSGHPADALERFSLPRAEHSSRGPTADDRCKPDIVAPGNCLVPSADSSSGYEITGDWSSFATPVVAGTAALLVQKATSDPTLAAAVSKDGGNCVMKAILMNSATKLPYWHKGQPTKDDDHTAVLDYLQGAGMLNAVGAYQQLTAGHSRPGEVPATGWDNSVIQKKTGIEHVYSFSVAEPAGQRLTATLVWNRHFEPEHPFLSLRAADSDLTLELWAVDPENADRNRLLDYSDSVNDNVEHIWCPLDADYTRYEVVVTFSEIAGDVEQYPSERYGLAWRTAPADNGDSIFWYDLDLDGDIDSDDLILLMNRFVGSEMSSTGFGPGDIDMNGVVDIKDMQSLMARVQQNKP